MTDHGSIADPSTAAFGLPSQPPSNTDSNRSHDENETRLSAGRHRAHKHRPSGGFLLANPLLSRHDAARRRDPPTRVPSEKRQRKSTHSHTHRGAQNGHGEPQSGASPSTPSGGQLLAYGTRQAEQPAEDSPAASTVAKRHSLAGDTAVGSSPRTSMAPLDMESAQIVNMALNLSESRRLASRRNVTQPAPPRLAPLPDSALGGSLRHHLQQQRKASRTVSPKPDRSPRIGAGRVLTPLQPAFEPGATYRYHFSQSTLARAQKAKEYLELMAQYRRVLELLAPLEPERKARPWSASASVTPNGSAPVFRVPTRESDIKIGRPYNPLQYIRNRKVRARERRAIDGEAQGFNDVLRVSEWVDEVAKWVATGQARLPGNPALPPFGGAQAAAGQALPPTTTTARGTTVAKPRRPRVDWVINPADMLADVYWLEQDDHKKLVEDRHWRRVFPQGPDVSRPLSREETLSRMVTPGSTKDLSDAQTPAERATPDPPPSRHEHEHVLSAARDRAQQKLRSLKGSHHRHTSSAANHDLLRLHRGSLSESSDTDSDRRRRATSALPGGRSLLEKQMEELIAEEQREAELHPLYEPEAFRMKPAPTTPDQEPQRLARNAALRQRADSRDLSESEAAGLGLKPLPLPYSSPPQTIGRSSLEVPGSRRVSVDTDASQPSSPNLRPAPDPGRVTAIGVDLSPISSRASSPHRNPLTKVKSIFRERSKERSAEPPQPAEEPIVVSLSPPSDSWASSPEPAASGVSSPQRRPSRSPAGLGHRSHKSLSSAMLRGEDGGISLRSLLRGPRIDTVLRSGVSKVSDMIWRKDGGADEQSSSTSSDDSESESRGRSRNPRHGRSLSAQDARQLLEPAPLVPDHGKPGHLQHPPARPISRRSSRFELLKPPRIDVQNASPSTSPPPPVLVRPSSEPVGSDTESQAGRDDVRTAAARLDAALALPDPPLQASSTSSSRQWSIADRSTPARPAVSKREIARLRALLLSAGIHAMEMDRRAKQRKLLSPSSAAITRADTDTSNAVGAAQQSGTPRTLSIQEIARLAPDAETRDRLLRARLSQTEIYPAAARALSSSIDASTAETARLSARFASEAAPALHRRVEALRARVADDLTALAQAAVDAADEANHDLVVGQRLKAKAVVDAIAGMLRRRRRRFRWARRAGWLVVEWLLVGCMWYVWFVVMLARVFLGVGKGVVRGVRWLLWM